MQICELSERSRLTESMRVMDNEICYRAKEYRSDHKLFTTQADLYKPLSSNCYCTWIGIFLYRCSSHGTCTSSSGEVSDSRRKTFGTGNYEKRKIKEDHEEDEMMRNNLC